jgi:hypothetical protein
MISVDESMTAPFYKALDTENYEHEKSSKYPSTGKSGFQHISQESVSIDMKLRLSDTTNNIRPSIKKKSSNNKV